MRLFRRKEKGRKPPPIPKEAILRSKVVRNPAISWEKRDSGEVMLKIKLSAKPTGIFSGFIKYPEEKKILLDEVGGYVWELSDGSRTVSEIINALAERFQLHRREVEASFLAYLKMLMERRLVGLILPPEYAQQISTKDGSKRRPA